MANLNSEITVPIRDLGGAGTLTITVDVTREFKIRMAIGLFLIRCAVRVMNLGIQVHERGE